MTGLVPRLKANAIVSGTGSRDWRFARFTPGEGDSPLAAMFRALCAAFPEHAVSPFMVTQEKEAFIDSVTANPSALIDICDALLAEAKAPAWAEIFLFVDQFEELFTLVRPGDRAAFIAVLEAVNRSRRLRCVVTMRSDFMATAIEYPALATLINSGNYVLAPPTAGALVEMIKRPAERAGLTWADGLPERIQHETGSGSGALAVMAYALDELYHAASQDKRLTVPAYEAIGGVEGAIGKRAGDTFDTLNLPDKDAVLKRVFRELVTVNESGTPTRQRAWLRQFDQDALTLINAFVNARLLVTHEDMVEVAHEALFRSWTRLKDWIAEAQEDLILLRQVRTAAEDWHKRGRPDFLLWPQERLVLVYTMQDRLHPELNEVEQDFIEPEQKRLLRELEQLPVEAGNENRRLEIGDRLAAIGDPRPGVGVKDTVPDMTWLPVEVSPDPVTIKTDEMEIGPLVIHPFFIARYQVTYAQYRAFVEAEDGYQNKQWWLNFPKEYQPQTLNEQRTKSANNPRDSISWYQSVAFARWMNRRLQGLEVTHTAGVLRVGDNAEIRLPTEWEWQWAAQGGAEGHDYPWGGWQTGHANTSESGLGRAIAVGMYPHGVAECGALDMAGNLREWCQNDHGAPTIVDGYSNGNSKVLRGGAFLSSRTAAAASYRSSLDSPGGGFYFYGVRLVLSAPVSVL